MSSHQRYDAGRRVLPLPSVLGVALAGLSGVSAAPWSSVLRRQNNSNSSQNNGDNFGGVTPQIWIPAVIVVLVLLVVFSMLWTRRGLVNRMRSSPSRDVTADQLAARGRTGETPGNATRPARTGRRTRRTPSQISTKSLPVYMKEPGDQELVIFRGPEDMEDERTRMPSVDGRDHDSISAEDNPEMREAPTYTATPGSPHDEPLLHSHSNSFGQSPDVSQGNSTVDVSTYSSTHHLMPSRSRDDGEDNGRNGSRPSFETTDTSPDRDGSATNGEGTPATSSAHPTDERGEAPPYWEVVPQGSPDQPGESSGTATRPPPPGLSPTTQTPATNSNRRSVFRFFNALSSPPAPTIPPAPPVPDEATNDGAISSTHGHRRYRASQSGGSGSTMSLGLTPFRTLSRQRSTNTLNSSTSRLASASNTNINNLTSPSAISVNSISAPLTHTLTKTEIRYPKGGPTPEQIKMLSSRESLTLGRFALPFGDDAIKRRAAAANESRLDGDGAANDEAPPPGFLEHLGGSEHPEVVHGMAGAITREASTSTVTGPSHPTHEEADDASLFYSPPKTVTDAQMHITVPESGSSGLRPVSRASTTMTYETAAESIVDRASSPSRSESSPPSPIGLIIHVQIPSSNTHSPEVSPTTPTRSTGIAL